MAWLDARVAAEIALRGGGRANLLRPVVDGDAVRLWVAEVALDLSADEYLRRWGSPIVYGHITKSRPLSAYQTVFADVPGSAEVPSAARPFTAELVTRLLVKGVDLAPIVLHCGVSSLEAHEPTAGTKFASSLYMWARAYAGLSQGHSRGTRSRNRAVISGHQRTRRQRHLSSGGACRTQRDT